MKLLIFSSASAAKKFALRCNPGVMALVYTDGVKGYVALRRGANAEARSLGLKPVSILGGAL